MKKIISIILCLAMIFAMAATAFAATDAAFEVRKTDEEGNPLEGAAFVLIPATTTEVAYEVYSDENGKAFFTGIADGSYILKENTAPEGYIKSDMEYPITVKDDQIITGQNADGTPIFYDNQNPYVFVNKTIDNSVEVRIPVTKVVEQTGFKAPGAETFTFEVFGFGNSNPIKWSYVSNTVETNGAGTYKEDIIIKTEEESLVYEPFFIKETKGTKEGWTYSEDVYKVIPVFENNDFAVHNMLNSANSCY